MVVARPPVADAGTPSASHMRTSSDRWREVTRAAAHAVKRSHGQRTNACSWRMSSILSVRDHERAL